MRRTRRVACSPITCGIRLRSLTKMPDTPQSTPWQRMAKALAAPPRCIVCGRFVPISDLADGSASHRLVTPESLRTRETFETLCRRHAHA